MIRVRLGDIVPADARLLGGDPIEVDQSALTGESLPVERKPGEALYSGSIIRQDETDALVYGTGQNTYLGRPAQLVGSTHGQSFPERGPRVCMCVHAIDFELKMRFDDLRVHRCTRRD